MKKKVWTQVTFHVAPEFQDLLVGQLATLGFGGFLQEDRALACFIEKNRWTTRLERTLRVLLESLKNEFPALDIRFRTKSVPDRNWNARWERGVGIVEATDRIIIKPSWKKLSPRHRGKIVLHIDPKMSFGTGHHESTRLCLVLLQEYLRTGARVLDFGSGTGVQAIAAVKLGARSAVAIDNDSWAVDNARENVKKNRAARTVKVLAGDLKSLPDRRFDLIVANIDMPTIKATLAQLLEKLRPESIIILSGILTSDLTQFMDFLSQQGVVPLEIVDENEWVAIALTNVDAADRD
ncbi:MAG: 50S ribosomal protein L11 methyltransferase [Ignavibacteria bacterium]|nr:50S ribosomal protein L11 methyltransferase [Ignavibacteria bacterium]